MIARLPLPSVLCLTCSAAITVIVILTKIDREVSLVAEPLAFDIGRVEQGDRVHDAVFRIENRSDTPICIDRLITTYGCASASISHDTLEPRTTAVLTAKYVPEDARGETVTKVVVMYSSTTKRSRFLALKIHANVIPDFTFEPETIVFSHAESDSKQVVFTKCITRQLEIEEAVASSPAFSTRIVKPREGTTDGSIIVAFDSSKWRTNDFNTSAFVTLRVASRNVSRVRIPIWVSLNDEEI